MAVSGCLLTLKKSKKLIAVLLTLNKPKNY